MSETVKAHASELTYPWPHQRRFNAAPQYFRRRFGGRLQKVSIDAGFSCPNRDGTCGTGGCTFCNNEAFNPSYCDPAESITTQIERGIVFQKRRYHKPAKHLAYFQAFSNTHAPASPRHRSGALLRRSPATAQPHPGAMDPPQRPAPA